MNVAMLFRRARTLAPQALLVLVLVALLAACGSSAKAQTAKGGGSGASGSGKPIDACALVTKAEAEALLGVPVNEPKPDTIQGVVTTCTYLASAPRDSRSVFVWVNPRQTADGARTVLENTKKDAPTLGATAREQAGLGDSAFWINNQLWVRQGKVVLGLWADTEANTQQLAGQVLKRLP
jgi:hypothetical protein